MGLVYRRGADAHVHRNHITTTQEYRGRVEYWCVISGEEQCGCPVVWDAFHSHGEGVGHEFSGPRCGIRDCHVVGGLLARLNGVVVGLSLCECDLD